jgi:virulence factor Mce-like protein
MRTARRRTRLFDDPFLNGLVTLIVILAAVYVSYTANNGIPFTPTYRVSVDVPDAGQLVKHAEVRVGGARVGQVLKIHAMPRTEHHAPYARLDLALDTDLKPLAVDSASEVRIASILGGKYVSIVPGHGARKLGANDVLPLSRAKPSVDIDQAFRVLDPPTRHALARSITELGNAFVGRGVQLNSTIAALSGAAPALQRVLGQLADPRSDLSGLLSAAAGAVTTLAPVGGQLAGMVAGGAATLRAVNQAGNALGEAIDGLPSAEAQTTTTLTHLRPALADAAAIGRDVEPAAGLLPRAVARLDTTLRTGTPVAREARTLAAPLSAAFRSVDAFSGSRNATGALHVLGGNDLATFGASGFVGLGGILAALSDAQVHCNVLALWTRNLASIVSDGDRSGAWVRLGLVLDLAQSFGAATPAGNLHLNAYPNENAQECEAGNEPYGPGQAIGNPAGNQSTTVDQTAPPAAATRRARAAGLLKRSAR